MPSNSYLSLLVLALAAATVSPVRCAETQKVEDRGQTSSAPAPGSRHHTRGRGKQGTILGLGLAGFLLTVALVNTLVPYDGTKNSANHPKPPTSPSPSPPDPSHPTRAFVGREERDFGRGFPVDPSKARSINKQVGRTSSSLDLLSRADLRKELILFSRMLDKLD